MCGGRHCAKGSCALLELYGTRAADEHMSVTMLPMRGVAVGVVTPLPHLVLGVTGLNREAVASVSASQFI